MNRAKSSLDPTVPPAFWRFNIVRRPLGSDMRLLAIFIFLLSSSSPGFPPDRTCFTSRGCLSEQEQAYYDSRKDQIRFTIKSCNEASDCFPALKDLRIEIATSALVPKSAQVLLLASLNEGVADKFPACGPLFRELAAIGDEALNFTAVEALSFSGDEWLKCPELVSSLKDLLDDRSTASALREAVLWLFRFEDRFEEVSERALAIVRREQDRELARLAAKIFVNDLIESEQSLILIRKLILQETGELQQEAARELLAEFSATEDLGLFSLAVKTVGEIALSRDISPVFRGDAIDSLTIYPDHPEVVPILLSLLQAENWFFGAAGQHFPIHSLSKLIQSLAEAEDPRIQAALRELWNIVPGIAESEGRGYVEWCLEMWAPKIQGKTPNKSLQPPQPSGPIEFNPFDS